VQQPSDPGREAQLLVLSARTASALEARTDELRAHLEAHPDLDLADVAFTLQVGRRAYPHRRCAVVTDMADAAAALGDPQRLASSAVPATAAPVVFLFPGQGAQHVGMARGLYESEPVFQHELDACAEGLRASLGRDLRELLYPPQAREELARELAQTALTQPALFAVEYALAKLWMSWGVAPAAMLGHSVGELVAACLAGVFALPDALRLVAARGRLMQEQPPGDMLGVALAEDELRALLPRELSLAAVNGPTSCTVAGPSAAVRALQETLQARGVACRPLHTSHAFHSAMMDPVAAPFVALVREVQPSAAAIPCISTVTGALASEGEWTDPAYWGRNVRDPVRFSAAARAALADPSHVLLEVGPGNTLSTLVRQHPEATARRVVTSLRHPQETTPDVAHVLQAAGKLWLGGVRIDWTAFHAGMRRRRVPLPTYPFERQRYWLAPAATAIAGAPRRRTDRADWFYAPSWLQQPRALSAAPPARAWLVFTDESGLGEALAARLPGAPVATVRAGARFVARGGDAYEVRPGSRDDLAAVLADLRARGRAPDRVVHLWGALAHEPRDELAALDATHARGFATLLALAQELAATDAPARVDVITDDLFAVTGEEARRSARATMLGLLRVVPLEHPALAWHHVDVHLGSDAAARARVAEQIGAELNAAAPGEVVALRGPHRWVQATAPVRLASPAARVAREGGVHLITGGLGGIGLVLAEHLAQTRGVKLILLARRTELPRDRIAALEARGAEVLVVRADVADERQLAAAIAQAKERFGAIHGVVHAAGISTGGLLALRERADAEAVLAPKVRGTLLLARALRDEQLDFFALCSSLNSIAGAVGAVDYCGANAFLDALALDPAFAGVPFVSISWDAWREVGMAADTQVSAALAQDRKRALALGLTNEEGADVFARAVHGGLRHVYVSTHDLEARRRAAAAPPEQAVEAPATETHARPALATAYAAPETDLQRTIAGVVQHLLGIDRVGLHDNFFDLGFDSLLSHRLVARLKQETKIALPINAVLESPSVGELAKYAEVAQWVGGG
jgi:acyl transferase domain-containing protein